MKIKIAFIGFIFLNALSTYADSQSARQDKSFVALGQVAGIGPTGIFTTGVSGGVFLDPQSLITVI